MPATNLMQWAKTRGWFYAFELPDGSVTATTGNASILALHAARAALLRMVLEMMDEKARVGDVLDVACHEGWFTELLSHHAEAVLGVDKNKESIEAARGMVQEILDRWNTRFRHLPEGFGRDTELKQTFELVVCFGLLYHHDDPVGLVRALAHHSSRAVLIETQLAPTPVKAALPANGANGTAYDTEQVPWGAAPGTKNVEGWFALVQDDEGRDGGMSRAAFVPTPSGVAALMLAAGLRRVGRLDQGELERGNRGMWLGWKD